MVMLERAVVLVQLGEIFLETGQPCAKARPKQATIRAVKMKFIGCAGLGGELGPVNLHIFYDGD